MTSRPLRFLRYFCDYMWAFNILCTAICAISGSLFVHIGYVGYATYFSEIFLLIFAYFYYYAYFLYLALSLVAHLLAFFSCLPIVGQFTLFLCFLAILHT